MADSAERPLASVTMGERAHDLFALEMSPEEYVVRCGSGWTMCSFPPFSYRDAKLDEWLQQFDLLMRTPGKLEELRERFLTPAEIESERQRDATRWN